MVCSGRKKKMTPIFVDPATLTPTGHSGSPSVTVQPISAAKTCTELKTCECFNVRMLSKSLRVVFFFTFDDVYWTKVSTQNNLLFALAQNTKS